MPTGTGKSVVIANFIRKIFEYWPNQRIMMLTHVKKLISQNAEKLLSVWPVAPMGIYSAGLNSREMIVPIVFGGVQSVAPAIKKSLEAGDNKPPHLRHFGWRDLLIIDEAHLLSPSEDTQYQYIIAELKKINPNLKVIGFTATPYRLKQGMITEDDGIFTDICYDITGIEAFNRLIAEGYLSPLISRPTATKIDTSNLNLSNGDFNGKQAEDEAEKVIYEGLKETCELAYDRNHWLIFAAGVKNAEHIASMLNSFGIPAIASHSKLTEKENDIRMAAFEAGEYRALVGMNKYTTGYDFPAIDLIADFQPTMSPGIHVQKGGRGTRPSPDTGKENCLFLDFAGNVKRLGPINDPVKPRKPGKGAPGDAPVRICENCGVYNHASARHCINCGTEFSFETKLFANSFGGDVLRSDAPIVDYFNVQKIIYNLHEKRDANGVLTSPPSIKVSYFCGFQMFNEWLCLEHPGLAGKRARDWWRQRHYEDPPVTTYEALRRVSELRVPSRIRVWTNKKYPEILSAEW
jgi:DNA repair protein RadD